MEKPQPQEASNRWHREGGDHVGKNIVLVRRGASILLEQQRRRNHGTAHNLRTQLPRPGMTSDECLHHDPLTSPVPVHHGIGRHLGELDRGGRGNRCPGAVSHQVAGPISAETVDRTTYHNQPQPAAHQIQPSPQHEIGVGPPAGDNDLAWPLWPSPVPQHVTSRKGLSPPVALSHWASRHINDGQRHEAVRESPGLQGPHHRRGPVRAGWDGRRTKADYRRVPAQVPVQQLLIGHHQTLEDEVRSRYSHHGYPEHRRRPPFASIPRQAGG